MIRSLTIACVLLLCMVAAMLVTSSIDVQAQDSQSIPRLDSDNGSELQVALVQYAADRSALMRRWDVEYSDSRRERLRKFYTDWNAWAAGLDYQLLSLEGAVDQTLFTNLLDYELKLLEREAALVAEMASLVPFAQSIIDLQEQRREFEFIAPEDAAQILAGLPSEVDAVELALKSALENNETPSRIVALRAANWLDELTGTVESWYAFYAGYDPLFTWWNEQPYEKAKTELDEYKQFLEEKIIGFREGEDPPIVGDPIGAEGLADDLTKEMIPYSAQQLIAIAREEFAWCERELLKASRELGYGDDWKAAQEYVKSRYVEPGQQTALVRDLAEEAVQFLESRQLVTVPELAKEVWRMEMLSPERQKVAPFFLGGEVVQVAFPTNTMEHDDKLMSLRGNNEHYSRAVVHHELIPGHHLQGFMTSRHNVHRRIFGTPFWGEGWALYWEMLLWDEGFPRTSEDKIGMLFWRMHRAARIIFSLSFHLGEMTPDEAIDFLVDRVGHERANATAEVRRSFNGTYSPLYQAAYMLGGIQLRGLHKELVQSRQMTNMQFHDTILKGGRMPIEMVRARLSGMRPEENFESGWRFYD